MKPTYTIGPKERAALHWLMVRRLFILGQDPPELARMEGVSLDELATEFSEDLRLMSDLGWEVEVEEKPVGLTMPAENLEKTLKRLRRDARRGPSEPPREHEPPDDEGRWERFREAVDACEEALNHLDSRRHRDKERGAPAESSGGDEPELAIPEAVVLAALERAARHERSDEVSAATLMAHLGFRRAPNLASRFHRRFDEVRSAGLLARVARDGGDFWAITSKGREELSRRREAGEVADLFESPQHVAWRQARVQSGLCIEAFKEQMATILGAATELITQPHPTSTEWLALSEKLSPAAWRLGSAIHCLYEWDEPDDDFPDIDEAPGPSPGRRAISAWDEPRDKSGGPL